MKVFARISMYLDLSDEECRQLLEEAGVSPSGESNEFDINKDFARRFVEHGELAEDSYIPQGCIKGMD